MTQEGILTEPDDSPLTWAQLQRYIEAPRRRPLTVAVPWAAVVLLSIAALFILPKKYKSSTLILVESEKVPDSFVPKVATDDRTARLEAIRPEILSRTRLERVLDETRPYPDLASKTQAVEKLRRSTFINVSGNDGFTIDFVHNDAHKAQEVTSRLATLFIEETLKSREQQVEGAVDFLVTQVNDARKELEKKDEAVRRYKEAHMGTLPEQLQTNLATMGMLQRELQTTEESLVLTRERQEALARGLERAAAAAPADAGTGAGTTDMADLRRQLAALKGRYTDEHPDVQRLRARIARIEARLIEAPAGPETGGVSALVSREQFERADLEVKRLEDKRADLERRIAVLRANVEETPRTEQELATLTRDYQKLNDNYVALLSKQLEAQMAGRLEQRWKGDRFRMLDPASLPEKPYFPRPTLVLALGVFLGLVAGLGVSLVAEYLDPTVKDVHDLEASQAYPVLACIPHLAGLGAPTAR
jgi:polysaccharide chain length determinant protein (PEP-CTERM system associated)